MARSDRRSILQGTCGGKLHTASTEQKGLAFSFYFGLILKRQLCIGTFLLTKPLTEKHVQWEPNTAVTLP